MSMNENNMNTPNQPIVLDDSESDGLPPIKRLKRHVNVITLDESDDDLPEVIMTLKPILKADEDELLKPVGSFPVQEDLLSRITPSSKVEHPFEEDIMVPAKLNKSKRRNKGSEFSLDSLVTMKDSRSSMSVEMDEFRRNIGQVKLNVDANALRPEADRAIMDAPNLHAKSEHKESWPQIFTILGWEKDAVSMNSSNLRFKPSSRPSSTSLLESIRLVSKDICPHVEPSSKQPLSQDEFDSFLYLLNEAVKHETLPKTLWKDVLITSLTMMLDSRYFDSLCSFADIMTSIIVNTRTEQQMTLINHILNLSSHFEVKRKILILLPKCILRILLAWKYFTDETSMQSRILVIEKQPKELFDDFKTILPQIHEMTNFESVKKSLIYFWYSVALPRQRSDVWNRWANLVKELSGKIRDEKASHLDRTEVKDSLLMFEIIFQTVKSLNKPS